MFATEPVKRVMLIGWPRMQEKSFRFGAKTKVALTKAANGVRAHQWQGQVRTWLNYANANVTQ